MENKQCWKEESVYQINYMLPLVISQEVQTTEKNLSHEESEGFAY